MAATATQPATRRLFIGLMADSGVAAAVARQCHHWHWPAGCKPADAGRLHLTLHFLGEVDPPREQALRQLLRDVRCPPFDLLLTAPRVWPGGIAVLLPREQPALLTLRERTALAVTAAGLRPAARFTPHVTVARHQQDTHLPEELASVPWPVREFALVWSRLPPRVARADYQVLERYAL